MPKKSFYGESAGFGDFVQLLFFKDEDFDLLKKHQDIKRIQLWVESQCLENLDFLLECTHLEDLAIYGGRIGDYSALGKLPNLKHLFLNGRLRLWLLDFDFLCDLLAIEQIYIRSYPMPTCFPNLQKSEKLINLTLDNCKRLEDISNISSIPNLQGFTILNKSQNIEDLEFIAKKPGMKVMAGQFGTERKNKAFHFMIKKHGLHNGHIGKNGSIQHNKCEQFYADLVK